MKRLAIIILPVVIIIIWIIITAFQLIDPLFLPGPLPVLESLFNGLLSGQLFKSMLVTILRAMTGFFISAIIGIPIGLLVGRIKLLSQATQPTIDFFRSIPATAMFPLFLFFFGIGDVAKISIVVYACSLIILVNTSYGAKQVKKHRILCAKVEGAKNWELFWKIIIPESSPGILAGLRVALSLSFVLIVVTEMFIGTTVGLGYEIMNAQMVYRIPYMYAAIVLTGIVGYLGNQSLVILENKILHWVGK